MQTTLKRKITLATLKSFVKKNRTNLFILVKSDFDGMTDCVSAVKSIPHKIEHDPSHETYYGYTLGIKGVHLVGNSRDWFESYNDEMFTGIEVTNSCGNFILAIIK